MRFARPVKFLALMVLTFSSAVVDAAEGATILVPEDYVEIQAAIDAASAGDSVLVGPGTYMEQVRFNGKSLVLKGTAGPNETVIDGGGVSACVVLSAGEGPGSVVSGFVLTDGFNEYGGGGIHLKGSSPRLEDLIITGCHSGASGGGIYASQGAAPVIYDCLITACSSEGVGGAVASSGSYPRMERTYIVQNSAKDEGGGIWANHGSIEVVNCTFYGNRGLRGTHGVFTGSVAATLRNVIATNSSGTAFYSDGRPDVTASYISVFGNEEAFENIEVGEGISTEDPQFEGGFPYSYALAETSPCVDSGDPFDAVPPGGGKRVDIGAHELVREHHVIEVYAGESIAAAIDSAEAGTWIRVHPGTYSENLDLMGKAIEIEAAEGRGSVVLDGGGRGPAIWFHRNEDHETKVRDLVIRNGFAQRGGGILIEGASPTLQNLVLEANSARADGGAIYVRNWCNPIIEHVEIRDNFAADYGGGIAVFRANPLIRWSVIHHNGTNGQGAAISVRDSDAVIRNCTISHNRSYADGTAGIQVSENSAGEIRNNIISHSVQGTGISVDPGSVPDLGFNCSWGNASYDFVGTAGGEGAFSADPVFVGGDPFDYHLASGAGYWNGQEWVTGALGSLSPCIDAGDPAVGPEDEPVPNGVRRNLGAYGGTAEGSRTPGRVLEVPTDFASITEALESAIDGDTVHVGTGVFEGPVRIAGVLASLVGDGIGKTVVSGGGHSRCLEIQDVSRGDVVVRGITFESGNAWGDPGGALWIKDASPMIQDCEIRNSRASSGGGMFVDGGNPTLQYSIVHDNYARDFGGGIAFVDGAEGTVFRTAIWADSAGAAGGGVYCDESTPQIINCTLDQNWCADIEAGGGVHVGRWCAPVIRSTSISNTVLGYGTCRDLESTVDVRHSNAYNNAPSGDWGNFPGGTPQTCDSVVPRYTYEEPLYGLSANSRLIDAGDPDAYVPEGGGKRVDVGAYEFMQRTRNTLEVPTDYSTIGAAFMAATDGDTVRVLPGTYRERLRMEGVGVNFVAASGDGEVIIRGVPDEKGDPVGSLLTIAGVVDEVVVDGFVFEGGNAYEGGGILLDHSLAWVRDCEFRDNLATFGGGVALQGSNSVIERCRFLGNQADGGGGAAVSCRNGSSPVLRNNLMARNYTNNKGGAIYVSGSDMDAENNTIADNGATYLGSGIYVVNSDSTLLVNNIVARNVGSSGIVAAGNVVATLLRNNVWKNDVRDYSGLEPGANDISDDPLFVGGEPYDYHLQSVHGSWHDDAADFVYDELTSTSIDRGVALDVGDEPAPNGGRINLGFAGGTEFASKSDRTVVYVPTPENPTIQAAIDNALMGDQILVYPGTYSGPIRFNGASVIVEAIAGRDSTVLTGLTGFSIVEFVDGEGPDAVLDGFTLRGGFADYGGAIRVERSGPTIMNCIFEQNAAGLQGGAIYVNEGVPRIRSSLFRDNWSPVEGGAIHVESSVPRIEGNVFVGNRSEFAGGALSLVGAHEGYGAPVVTQNYFSSNSAQGSGGGAVVILGASPQVLDNVFVDNTTPFHGGGLYATGDGTSGLVFGNRFVGNSAHESGGRGGAMACRYVSWGRLNVVNNTLTANSAEEGAAVMVQSAEMVLVNNILMGNRAGPALEAKFAEPFVGYNDFWNNPSGDCEGLELDETNLFLSPEFADTSLVLNRTSPLIDAGYGGAFLLDPDGSRSDLGYRAFTHSLYVDALPDSTEVGPGKTFGMVVTVSNPDLQDQGPVRRVTTVRSPGGMEFIANEAEFMVTVDGEHHERIEGEIPAQAPLGIYTISVRISVNDVPYDETSIELEVR